MKIIVIYPELASTYMSQSQNLLSSSAESRSEMAKATGSGLGLMTKAIARLWSSRTNFGYIRLGTLV